MVFIDVIGPAGARTVAFPIAELNIGSASDCELMLDHEDVAPHHVSMIERGGRAVVLRLGASTVLVNGEAVTEATVLTEACEVVIGPFRLHVRHVELAPDTIQTQTVRQPSAPPIPMADADIEILSASHMQVHSSEIVATSLRDVTKSAAPEPAPPEPAPPEPAPPEPSTLSSKRLAARDLLPIESADPQGYDAQVSVETDPSIPVASIKPLADDSGARSIQSLFRASNDPIEAEFLRAIVEDEDATAARVRYADWLEERGAVALAEYMRILDSLEPNANPKSLEPTRLRVLGKQIANPWRATVASRSTPIECCPRGKAARSRSPATTARGGAAVCPKTWGALERWLTDDIRSCEVCDKPVAYLSEMDEARRWVSHGNPVVIDPSVWRTSDDLDRLPPSSHYVIEGQRQPKKKVEEE